MPPSRWRVSWPREPAPILEIRPHRSRVGALLLSALLALFAAGEAMADRAFAIREVAPGVFAHFGQTLALDAVGHDDIANIGFIVGNRCVAVIDTGGSTAIGRALRAEIERRTRLPICYVINTHVHVDHVLGNAAFVRDRPRFVGHAMLAEAMARSRDFFLRQYAGDLDQPASADQIVPPDELVRTTRDLDLGGRHLTLQAWPTAHTDCDLTVLDVQSGTLWTGDLLFRERLPALDGSAAGWLAVIHDLERVKVRRAVPGHGTITANLTPALEVERRYLQALLTDVRRELAQGISMQDAIGQTAAEEKPNWLLWDTTHPHNVVRVYQQLEWE